MRIPHHPARHARKRRGKILVLTAALMPVLVGGVALTVDTGVLGVGRAQVRTASDAAALAGALELAAPARLMSNQVDMTTLIANAQSAATARGQSNAVLGQTPMISEGDVTVGYFNPRALPFDPDYRQFITDTSRSSEFNSVEVTAARPQVPVFFGRIFGAKPGQVAAVSRATIENLPVKWSSNLLPIALDKTTYDAMVKGQTTDEYSFDPSHYDPDHGKESVTPNVPDGFKEARLYPVKNGDPGNFGTVKIGVNNNSTKDLSEQISKGITPTQMQNEFPTTGNLLDKLDSSTNPPTPYHTFQGNTGISSGIEDQLMDIIGKPVTIPIYDQSGGNGDNAWYRVIEFGQVRILAVKLTGGDKYVIIQPAPGSDPGAVAETDPSRFPRDWSSRGWTSGGVIRLHLSQ